MSELFGSDDLFNEFEKQPNTNKNTEVIAISDESSSEDASPRKNFREKEANVVFHSKNIVYERQSMVMPKDIFVVSLSVLVDRPNYSSTFRDPMTLPEPEEDKPQRPSRPKLSCFNCGGSHMLSNCKEPKDYSKISQKRREYNEANPPRPPAPPPQGPYSNSEFSGQIPPLLSFDHFKPGTISQVLREALGLYPNQIPPYVYFLRELGYPPGWLEEARVPLGSDEMSDVPLFSPTKIVEYAGYNIRMPSNVVDETRNFGVKRFDSRHSADAMRHWMDALKKHHDQRRSLITGRKASDAAAPHKHSQDGDDAMDLDDDSSTGESPIFASSTENTDVPKTSDDLNENSNSSNEAADIESLEKERENLLRLLESTLTGNAEEGEAEDSGQKEVGEEEVGSAEDGSQTIPCPARQSTSFSLGVSSGTPLPEKMSAKVPDREKFASGIGDHLPYQNLPESVGTFERLKRVLAGIRKRQVGSANSSTCMESSKNSGGQSSKKVYVDLDKPEESRNIRRDRRSMETFHPSPRDRSFYSQPRSAQPSSNRYRPY